MLVLVQAQPASAACPLGYFDAYYPVPSTGAGCLQTKPGLAGGAMGTVLNVAAELGLGVHVGLAMTATPLFTAHGIAMNTTTLAQYTSLCKGIGHGVWTAYGAKHASTIQGWYLGCYIRGVRE